MIIVADTSPINYLILIEQVDLLPRFYGQIIVPPAVLQELQPLEAPARVRSWTSRLPEWLEVRRPAGAPDPVLATMDLGEREAIALALELNAMYLIADDLVARSEALRRRLKVVGTLGILRAAAQQHLIDFPSTLNRLLETSFRVDRNLIRSLLDEESARSRDSA